jgi:hypothetical protein
MAQNKAFNLGPIALTTTLATNILNPPTASGGVNAGSSAQYILLRHIRITNKTGTAATFTLYKGATGANTAGTEIVGTAISVPANSGVDYWFAGLRFDAADFLVGGAGTTLALTISAEGEIGVAG